MIEKRNELRKQKKKKKVLNLKKKKIIFPNTDLISKLVMDKIKKQMNINIYQERSKINHKLKKK